MVKTFKDYIAEDASTTATVGSGTAVGGGAAGSFTSAAGTAVSGADSASSYSTNSNSGMGAIKSAQPSPTPGDVQGSIAGSGDIGTTLGTYTKQPAFFKKKGKKSNKGEEATATRLNNLYVIKFADFDGAKNIKENIYTQPATIKCKECGCEVCDNYNDMVAHMYLKHWAKPNNIMGDAEARTMVKRFFHELKD